MDDLISPHMFLYLLFFKICFQAAFSSHASGLPNTRKQHPFSSIYPRLSVPRRETTGLLLSISSGTGGALGDKFNSYQSPLARHQAHVVPGQMLLKCILFRFQCCVQFLIPTSITRKSHYHLSLRPPDFRLADYPIILPDIVHRLKLIQDSEYKTTQIPLIPFVPLRSLTQSSTMDGVGGINSQMRFALESLCLDVDKSVSGHLNVILYITIACFLSDQAIRTLPMN